MPSTLPIFPTGSFLDVYLQYCGDSEVPREYNVWCGVSLIAAALGNQLWIEKLPGQKLVPNLFVLLLGPSGLGKGRAIEMMMALAAPFASHQQGGREGLNLIRGKMSGQGLADWAASKLENFKRGKGEPVVPPRGHVYLVNEELGLCIGSGPVADGFVKYMTGLYTPGQQEIPFYDGTRTSGVIQLAGNLRINWLAGTTMEWLMQSVGPEAIEGGFFGRTAVVDGKYDFDKRAVRPRKPARYVELMDALRDRIWWLMNLGEMDELAITPRALEVEESWYNSRPKPEDNLASSWMREQDLVLKLSMVLAASEWTGRVARTGNFDEPLYVDHFVMIQALQMVHSIKVPMRKLLKRVRENPRTRPSQVAQELLRKHGKLDHSRLLQMVVGKGITAEELREAILMLEDMGYVKRDRVKSKNGRYKWTYRYQIPKVTLPAAEAGAVDGVDEVEPEGNGHDHDPGWLEPVEHSEEDL